MKRKQCIDDFLSIVGVALAQFNKFSSTFIKTIVLCYFDSYAIVLVSSTGKEVDPRPEVVIYHL